MNTQAQLRINLPLALQELLRSKASKFGVPLTQYVKHVLIKEVETEPYPVFMASEETEKAAKKALEELPKRRPITNIHSFFKKL